MQHFFAFVNFGTPRVLWPSNTKLPTTHTPHSNQPHTPAYVHKPSCAICSRTLVYIASACWQLDRAACNTTVDQQGHVQPNLECPAATKPWGNQCTSETHKNLLNHGKEPFFLFTSRNRLVKALLTHWGAQNHELLSMRAFVWCKLLKKLQEY